MAKKQAKPSSSLCQISVIGTDEDTFNWWLSITNELEDRKILAANWQGADVTMVIIGQSFLNNLHANTRDIIKQSLLQGKIVIPILVNDASIPAKLPADIKQLSKQQSITLVHRRDIHEAIAHAIDTYQHFVVQQNKPSKSPRSTESQSPYVFICYRRDDSEYYARLLATALANRIGSDRVFIDTQSQKTGVDYRKQITDALEQCTKLVVIIGTGFIEPDAKGLRRIDKKNDQVRREIRSGLTKKKPIHIVLTGDAQLPKQDNLPPDIADLVKTEYISKLESGTQVDVVAEEIVTGEKQSGKADYSLPGTENRLIANIHKALDKKKNAQLPVADLLIRKLSDYGWNIVSNSPEQYTKDIRYYLQPWETLFIRHPQYPNYRFVIDIAREEIILEENTRSVSHLGLQQWIGRSTFFGGSDWTDLMQLPAPLIEAAADPDNYLNRIGRVKFNRTKIRRLPDRLPSIMDPAISDMPGAETYQGTRRKVSAKGGLKPLVSCGSIIDTSKSTLFNDIAFHPDGTWLIIASENGIQKVNTKDWQTEQSTLLKKKCVSVSFSPQEQLAVGTEDNHLLILDVDKLMVKSDITPYSLSRRIVERLKENLWGFGQVSWSDDGDMLICCNNSTVWVYQISTGQWIHWRFPEVGYSPYEGVNYISEHNKLLVTAGRNLWLLTLPTMQIQSQIRLEDAIKAVDISPSSNIAAIGSSNGQIVIIDLISMQVVRTVVWHEPVSYKRNYKFKNHIAAVSFSPDGLWLASVGEQDGKLIVGDVQNWEPKRFATIQVQYLHGATICWTPCSTTIALSASAGIDLWRI